MGYCMKSTGFAWYQLSRREAALTACIGIVLLVLSILAIMRSGDMPEIDPQGATAPLALVDVNSATQAELMALPGIGERKAARIVKARKLKAIRSLKELAQAAGGIPATKLDRMRSHVAFKQRTKKQR